MSDDDDYLSDKFLAEAAKDAASPKTYSQLRKQAISKSHAKNTVNKTKSKRQRELEAREEGLSKSLFERAQEDEQTGLSSGNKALSMMMKMGFKPGQALGRQTEDPIPQNVESPEPAKRPISPLLHNTEPIPLNEWTGKKGIGTAKRARSPGTRDRIAKMAKMEEVATHRSFRDRARQEYEQRKSENRLGPAQRTCITLDEKAGKTLNVLWLNPNLPETFPDGLGESLALYQEKDVLAFTTDTIEEQLKKRMQADALLALPQLDDDAEDEEGGINTTLSTGTSEKKKELIELNQKYDPDFLEEVVQFLRLEPQDRLHLTLSYLRNTYAYCFYCGTEYENQEELMEQCPGPEEDDHD
ncbi:hypothetical protein AGABI1DRAFT_73191 [Agaricus bisporus var. burnettii JB137-S8]|uniref:G-patch domain-containing protein n=1 Tax=Agaricus bisporus var. burnettii (strain JB137-S8 / ATCC MYA-4627 / FGSC 10392) TaxID=597362 RepID=K5WXK4_AGABU|nr:uncharacterized protein AGABI1DRAFT_73191 [Agaricus bisporus var. burnettii JB137-S8]EKM80216.1 hypothetical protein AGABI1DRAFT_73191 [Agaricus bisporus var. burnettii JB137-S8]